MADIYLQRSHQLGLHEARKMARQWAARAAEKFDMECTYEEGAQQDSLCFARPGVKGTLAVQPDALEFHASLGFLVSAFRERIQAELEQQLDAMLAPFGAPGSEEPARQPALKPAPKSLHPAPGGSKAAAASSGKTSPAGAAAALPGATPKPRPTRKP